MDNINDSAYGTVLNKALRASTPSDASGLREAWLSHWEKNALKLDKEDVPAAPGKTKSETVANRAHRMPDKFNASEKERRRQESAVEQLLVKNAEFSGYSQFVETRNAIGNGVERQLTRGMTALVAENYKSTTNESQSNTSPEDPVPSTKQLPEAVESKLAPFSAKLLPASQGWSLWLRDFNKQYLPALGLVVEDVVEWLNQRGQALRELRFNGHRMGLNEFRALVKHYVA